MPLRLWRVSDLAWANLIHDKVRLAVTVVGIVFAVVLIAIELGLFLGFATATSSLIDNSGADLWMTAARVPYIEQGRAFSERKLSATLAVPGVADARKYIVRFGPWQRPDGRQESVQVVGFDPAGAVGRPWNVVAGRVDDLTHDHNVFVDELYKDKLGVSGIGDLFELRGHRARVVGFTRGIKPFTTTPYVFTSFKNAQDYGGVDEAQTTYILITADRSVDIETLRQRLLGRVRDVDVWTRDEFSRMTRFYWMFTTGAGLALLLAAILGLVVGIVVVAQTIYATTMDHVREYGTLKAIGASNAYLYRVIVQQAIASALIGYPVAMAVTAGVVTQSGRGGASILVPWQLAAGMLLLTIAMCTGAALVSINKVTRIDPATVFTG